MAAPETFLTGVVEGYYGRQWDFDTRLAYADYLSRLGLNTFLYCPKGDPWLRKCWQEPWPPDAFSRLQGLARAYRERGRNWGVGLSPFALYRDYGPAQREQLHRKVDEIAALDGSLLAVLFDDMPGDIADLASRQADIVNDVANWLPGVRLLVCPTYYSFDPVLEKHFGAMPRNYWSQLGRDMPAAVDLFWTGNKVCSDTINTDDIEAITAEVGRKVMLWDNYPVNDGALRSKFLYTEPLPGRDPGLRGLLTGHLCNPMNQGLLSLPALAGLAALYGEVAADECLADALGPATLARLREDGALFQHTGLEAMEEGARLALVASYEALPGAAAAEVAGWLRGEYTFDPACLTD